MGIQLGLCPDTRWDADVEQLASATGAAGFDSLGLTPRTIDATTPGILAAHGLRCGEVQALILRDDDDASAMQKAERIAGAAAAVGAPWVLTFIQMSPSTELTRIVERCAATLADAGTAMAVEFSPLCPIATIADALAVVADAGHGAGVLIDTWHFGMGESTWDDLERIPLELIAYVQFDDAPEPVGDDLWVETMDRRVMPGDGTFELERFASTLLERGWDGLVSVEVLNPGLGLDVAEFARRAHAATAPYWR